MMRNIIRWAVHNTPAMNTIMVAVLLLGAASLGVMRREAFPEFELEILLVTVPYPGASPSEVEEGICQKLEEAVRATAGIDKQMSIAREGSGFLILELDPDVADVQKILNEVRSEIDRIPSFPDLAEDPEVKQITLRQPAIRISVMGPKTDGLSSDLKVQADLQLRDITEQVRNDLIELPSVSQANIIGERDYQIDVEVPEATLRQYGLTLGDVANLIRRENVELPSGKLRSPSQEVLIRGKNKRLTGSEISEISMVTDPNGTVHTIGDLAKVSDQFVDETAISYVNQRPANVITVDRTSTEDLLAITGDVRDYVAGRTLPFGYEIGTWFDQSVNVRDRMELLTRNGLQGLVLVFLVLAVFLNLRLAFWVALGIPIAVLGAAVVLLFGGHTLNMLSMFAFLMALGIVVDDAIVIGENIHSHREQGRDSIDAAIEGAYEVLPAVLASVCTTIIAFVPLMFVAGIMGKFIAVMPVAVIAMLVISLFESTFILPCHLSHDRNLFLTTLGFVLYPFRFLVWIAQRANEKTARILDWVLQRIYCPVLRWSLVNWSVVAGLSVALLLVTLGLIASGITPWVLMGKMDSYIIEARIVFPDGTPGTVTDQACRRLESAMQRVNERYAADGAGLVTQMFRAVGNVAAPGAMGPQDRSTGSHIGLLEVELIDSSQRPMHSEAILAAWREEAGEFPGAESVRFGTPDFGPGGTPIEFKLLAPKENMESLEQAVQACKNRLTEFPGVIDIADDSQPGKWEFQLRIKDKARAMGIPLASLAETVRASYYGVEVQRLQRGRHEVKLMVRYPEEDRKSLADFEEIRVRTRAGVELPLTELAHIDVLRGYSEINRMNQLRSITITADVDETVQNASHVVKNLKMPAGFLDKLHQEYPTVSVRWEGQQEQTAESLNSLKVGFMGATFGMFVLLTLQFRSYFQPLLILMIIPFGAIGAIWGHALMGLPITLFSVFGLIALTGVVVNDSIVLIDFINRLVRDGVPLNTAIMEAGQRRFRPVLLTSITTVAGLLPILRETSFQAQILIPMATSLCFGLILGTFLVLIIVPTSYYVYSRLTDMLSSRFMGRPTQVAEAGVAHGRSIESPRILPVPDDSTEKPDPPVLRDMQG